MIFFILSILKEMSLLLLSLLTLTNAGNLRTFLSLPAVEIVSNFRSGFMTGALFALLVCLTTRGFHTSKFKN